MGGVSRRSQQAGSLRARPEIFPAFSINTVRRDVNSVVGFGV
jgi:hypothetical protein